MSGQNTLYNIDITRYPFSCRGSYWAFLRFDGFGKPPKALHLHDVWRNGEMELFRIELTDQGRAVEPELSMTPALLELTSDKGYAAICFQSADIVRVKAEKCGMKLSYPKEAEVVPINTNQFRVFIGNDRMVFSLLRGRFTLTREVIGNANKILMPGASIKNLSITVEPDDKGEMEFALERYVSEYVPKTYETRFDDVVTKRTSGFREFYRPIAAKEGPSREVQLAAYLDWSALVEPSGNFKRESMIMSKTWMNGLWSWDHCFNALAMSYSHPDIAWNQIMTMFDVQNELGALPDAIFVNDLQWAHLKIPMHGWTLMKMMENSPDFFTNERLEEIYPKLVNWTNFWFDYRDDDGNGIVQVNHGNDDFDWLPVFDAGFPMEDPQVNMMLVFQMEALSDIAGKLGRKAEAAEWKQHSQELTGKIIKRFWNGEKFLYKVSGTENYTEDAICILQYTPMLLGKRLPPEIRKKLVESFMNSGLMTKNGVLQVSRNSPQFDPETYTRGSIWAPLNYFIIEGLRACDANETADRLTSDFLGVMDRSGFSERFNPFTGDPWSDPSYTWTSSIYLILKYNNREDKAKGDQD